ncbi:hypothetical protein [Fodinicola acaciae]|uniref:hypothetical protein n=1 Tax=Fodinicola acaciae TaxID=2681555 RepID=UPI0013D4405B|nr:hypothetical protein [Fodinicola acaciae]
MQPPVDEPALSIWQPASGKPARLAIGLASGTHPGKRMANLYYLDFPVALPQRRLASPALELQRICRRAGDIQLRRNTHPYIFVKVCTEVNNWPDDCAESGAWHT